MFDSKGEITPPCGVPATVCDDGALFHHACLEPLPQQLEHPPVRDASRHELHQLLVVDAPEVVADVGVEHVVATLGAELPQRLQRHRRAPLRAGSRTSTAESPPRRSAPAPASPPSAPPGPAPSGSPAAASFHRPSGCTGAAPRLGRYSPARSSCAELFQEALDSVLLDVADRLAIDSRRAAVPPHSLPRFPQDVTPPDAGRTARGSASPAPAWPRPTAAVAVVALCRAALRPPGSLGPVLPAIPSRLPAPPT